MKTIITTLPIYNKIEKQCYERSKHSVNNSLVPIICPRHRLPSFQWMDGTDGATSVSGIELLDKNYTGVVTNPATNWATHINFQLGGDSDHFTHGGLEITDAQNDTSAGPDATATTNTFAVSVGQYVRVRGTLAVVSGAAIFRLYLGTTSVIITAGAVDYTFEVTASNAASFIQLVTTGAIEYTFTGVSIDLGDSYSILHFFPTVPALAHDYFSYNGDVLNYLLPTGNYYLRITMDNGYIYYSEWFRVDCVFDVLTEYWYNGNYDTFTTSGNTLISVIEAAAGYGKSDAAGFNLANGETINIIFYLTKNSGQLPTISIRDLVGNVVDSAVAVEGLNNIELTAAGAKTVLLYFANSAAANYSTSEIHTIRQYSTKYLIIDFHNDCDLGDFYYHGGFDQTLWIESEPMESLFQMEEDGVKNGEARFIRSFARQEKKYIIRTKELPDYMVDVFNRMRLHDSIQLTDRVGDQNYIYNLEVEHEWLGDDKYYAKVNLTFDYDESIVVAGCCNNII